MQIEFMYILDGFCVWLSEYIIVGRFASVRYGGERGAENTICVG